MTFLTSTDKLLAVVKLPIMYLKLNVMFIISNKRIVLMCCAHFKGCIITSFHRIEVATELSFSVVEFGPFLNSTEIFPVQNTYGLCEHDFRSCKIRTIT